MAKEFIKTYMIKVDVKTDEYGTGTDYADIESLLDNSGLVVGVDLLEVYV